MSATITVILVSIAVVGLFALGMSITLIFKGHHIKSEIGDNEHMRERGIKCAIQQMREEGEEGVTAKDNCGVQGIDCNITNCTSCGAINQESV